MTTFLSSFCVKILCWDITQDKSKFKFGFVLDTICALLDTPSTLLRMDRTAEYGLLFLVAKTMKRTRTNTNQYEERTTVAADLGDLSVVLIYGVLSYVDHNRTKRESVWRYACTVPEVASLSFRDAREDPVVERDGRVRSLCHNKHSPPPPSEGCASFPISIDGLVPTVPPGLVSRGNSRLANRWCVVVVVVVVVVSAPHTRETTIRSDSFCRVALYLLKKHAGCVIVIPGIGCRLG